MRRPPVACQRAVQSLQSSATQHIWVPDEVLSLAVHRFFHSTCPQQKRYGSNVPGPLEARKRATKRRMTASAGFYPQDSFPTSFSLGALFGYRSNPQNSWRYEPPSLPKDAPTLDTRDSVKPTESQPRGKASDSSPADHDIPSTFAQQSATLSEIWNQHVNLETVSQSPSNHRIIEDTLASDKEYEKCVKGFRASTVVTGDSRTKLMWEDSFRKHLPSAPFLWKYYTVVLQHALQLGVDPTPVLQSLLERDGYLLRLENPLHSVDNCVEFMDCLDSLAETSNAREKPLIGQVLASIAQSATQAKRSTTEAHDAVLLRLILGIGQRASYKGSASTTKLLYALAANLREIAENKALLSHLAQPKRIREIIVSTVCSVTAAPELFMSAERALYYTPRRQLLALVPTITLHFAKYTKAKSAESITMRRMNMWLQLLHQVDVKANAGKALLKAAMVPLAKSLAYNNSPRTVSPDVLVKAMLLHQNLDTQVLSSTDEPHQLQEAFVHALLQVQTEPKVYSELLDMALPLIAHHAGLSQLMRCIRIMEKQKLPLITKTNFGAYIAEKLAVLHTATDNLTESQLQSRAFDLQACEKLANALSRMGHTLPVMMEEIAALSGVRQFNNILTHAKANNALPIAHRDATEDLSLLERVAMVHQLAYHYSHDTTRTHREVWRSVYYLYRYLLSNSLPIGPLFTKAVVHSAITRPLAENRFVSARRLIWVCHLVARVEGDEVAARVENHFYTWRGELIGRAKQVFVGVGGNKYSKAHVGTMKRLKLI